MNQQQHVQKLNLPSRKMLEKSIKVIEEFRAVCNHHFETGYWATVDFPSRHHFNNIVQLQFRNPADVVAAYGEGLTATAMETLEICKLYQNFLQGKKQKTEKK